MAARSGRDSHAGRNCAPRGAGRSAPANALEPAVTVVIPTRNEAGNVDALVAALTDALDGVRAEVIFVDDSDDETPADGGPRRDRLEQLPIALIHRPQGERDHGLGGAVLAGLAAARGRYVCVMDGDLQHPPAVIHRLLAPADENELDLVLASRFASGSRVAALSLPRRCRLELADRRHAAALPASPARRQRPADRLLHRPPRGDRPRRAAARRLQDPARDPAPHARPAGRARSGSTSASGTPAPARRRCARRPATRGSSRACAIATAPKRLGAFALVGLTGIVVNELALAIFNDLGLGTGLLSLSRHPGLVAVAVRPHRPARLPRRPAGALGRHPAGGVHGREHLRAARARPALPGCCTRASACTTWSRT